MLPPVMNKLVVFGLDLEVTSFWWILYAESNFVKNRKGRMVPDLCTPDSGSQTVVSGTLPGGPQLVINLVPGVMICYEYQYVFLAMANYKQ